MLTAEQRELRELVRTLARERIAPRAAEIDESHEFPWDVVELYREHGLFGLFFDEEWGGTGTGVLLGLVAIEEISKVCATSGLILAVQELGSLGLKLAGAEEQKERWLPRLASGECLAAYALTEAGSGSDSAAMRTTARREGDEYVLDGGKRFITNAGVAGLYTVFAKTDSAGGPRRDLRLPRRGGHARVRGRAAGAEDGDRGVDDRRAGLRRLPDPGDEPARRGGRRIPDRDARSSTAPGQASLRRGSGSRRARPTTRSSTRSTRETMGKPIAEHQLVAAKLADMETACEAARGLLYRFGQMVDDGVSEDELTKASAMAKLSCSDAAMEVTTEAVQILGGYGYIKEYPVERMMRDAKITQIYEGTNEIQRLVIAREMLRERRTGSVQI